MLDRGLIQIEQQLRGQTISEEQIALMIISSSEETTTFDYFETINILSLIQLIHDLNITTCECSIGTLLLIKPTQSNGATGIIPITITITLT